MLLVVQFTDVPSKSSEFAHPDVIVGLTILSYRYEGLRWTDFEDIISNLRSTMTKEIGPFRLRKSSLRYAAWVKDAGGRVKGENAFSFPENSPPDREEEMIQESSAAAAGTAAAYDDEKEVVPLRLLKRSNEEQMQKIFELLKVYIIYSTGADVLTCPDLSYPIPAHILLLTVNTSYYITLHHITSHLSPPTPHSGSPGHYTLLFGKFHFPSSYG